MTDELDVAIVGAGPAGLSAALWAHTLGLSYAVFDTAGAAGGQLLRVWGPVADFLGASTADGAELARRFVGHLDGLGARVRVSESVTAIDVAGPSVETPGGAVRARHVVLATGVRRRTLGVPGEADEVGRGFSPAATKYSERFRGARTLVVGGGDAAFEEALILADVCERVTLAHRGDRPRARRDFRERVAASGRIDVLAETELAAIDGEPDVTGARLRGPEEQREIPVSGVFVCVGVAPRTELVAGAVELDEHGYVVADARQRTSADRVYAAGDVCAGSSLTIAAAVGQGAAAVKDVQRRIAVGRRPEP